MPIKAIITKHICKNDSTSRNSTAPAIVATIGCISKPIDEAAMFILGMANVMKNWPDT